jgi:RNA polymerase sigma factor for flagellar operon FliA
VDARQAIEAHLPLVRKIASEVRRHIGGTLDFDDLVSYGTRGLLEANERFDPKRGIAFSTFAYYRIRGAIYDGVREMGWRPQSRADRRQLELAKHANEVLQQAADDAPAPGAAGEAEAVESAITQVAATYLITLEAESWSRLPDVRPGPEAQTVASDERSQVRTALRALPEKERRLLELMYFEEKSLTEAGAAIGLSKSWSSRLHSRALKLLSDELQRQGGDFAQPQAASTR